MKIGIITYPFNANFGGILQNYALSYYLKEQGNEVQTICSKNLINRSAIIQFFAIIVRLIKKYILNQREIVVLREKVLNEENIIISRNTSLFITDNIKVRWVNNIRKDIRPNDYDMIVVGSDQVWRNNYNIQLYYLDFAKKWSIKRLSYAASFGTDNWEYSKRTTEKCRALIKLFAGLSVREKTAIDLCKKYFDVEPTWVLDPTFLLNKNNYMKFVECHSAKGEGRIFSYVLDKNSEKDESLRKICNCLNKDAFSINADVYNRNLPLNERVQPKVEEWLTSIYSSDFIFTDSFHGMVFSIIFEKPFVIFGNAARGLARFHSLLDYLGLEKLLISKSSDVNINTVNARIDYDLVKTKLEVLQGNSFLFLNNYLNK